MATPHSKDGIPQRLKMLYRSACRTGRWKTALQALMALGKELEKPVKQHLPEAVPFSQMTDEQLIDFIEALKRLDPELENSVQENRAAKGYLKNGSGEGHCQPREKPP